MFVDALLTKNSDIHDHASPVCFRKMEPCDHEMLKSASVLGLNGRARGRRQGPSSSDVGGTSSPRAPYSLGRSVAEAVAATVKIATNFSTVIVSC